ncbi:MAG: aldehyde dehydrogenase family protein, partial [Candidatus Eisenbacteria bacterium]|nr:aldehyde dehydrogenase family protein [Candidatus Eisenbacteria bacterium]
MSDEFLNFIGGKWVPARSGRTFPNHNPATGEVLGEFPASEASDLDDAVEAAAKAFRSWRLTPAPKRAEIVFRAGEIIRARKDDLARAMTREMGKILAETRGDVQEGIDMAYLAAGEGRRMYGVTTPSEMPDKWAMSVRCPVGVAGVITPWNFPFAIPAWKLMPALVAGNAAVFKPATDTPELAWHFVKVFEEAGLPPGVLNLVFGSGSKVGSPMVAHPKVQVISFTGSTDVGLGIYGRAGALGKRVSLEMGGKNAIIVMDDADLALAADAILWSAFGTTGQRCTACSRVLVQEKVHDELVRQVATRAQALRLGDGLDPRTEVGPLINRGQVETVERYVKIGLDQGARLEAGGERAAEGALAKGNFYRPTVFAGVKADARIAVEEIFGPVLAMVRVKDLAEAVEVNNASSFGLSSSIFTRDVNRAFAAMRDLDTGIVYVNHGTTGAETHLPFGGTRGTGNGHREAGHTMLDPFTEWKSVYVDFSGHLQRAQIDNN